MYTFTSSCGTLSSVREFPLKANPFRFAMPHSILRNDVAGRDVTRYLKLLLRKEGYTFKTTAEFEIVKSIKERVCFLTPTTQKEEISQT
ncbi:unnamed protein product, partial [Rotaria sordida]